MSRIAELFAKKNKNVLSVYFTAGYPSLDSTLQVLDALQEAGADLVEVGMPYSDPLADGPVIQASGGVALAGGMTIAKLFEQLRGFRGHIHIPVILMGYMNPVLQYGFERFCAEAAKVGVDGLILPDLPMYEFETEYGPIVKKYGLDFIFLVTPETSETRIRQLDTLSTGFLYAVSSSSTTGKDKDMAMQQTYFDRLRQLNLLNPVLVGFGIKDRATFQAASLNASGAIIGTAYIKALEGATDIKGVTRQFINSVLS